MITPKTDNLRQQGNGDERSQFNAAHGSAHDALIAAFIEGAKWWEYHKTGFTMWQSDQHDAEREAQRRAKNQTLGRNAPNQQI